MPDATNRYADVVISGLAHVDAPHVVSSDAIDAELSDVLERLRLRPGFLAKVAGIEERRVWDVGTMPSTGAAEAGQRALERSGVAPESVGLLVNTSVSRDYVEPSTASIVHGRLGLGPDAMNFDLGNACLGFVNGMQVAASMISRGEIDHGLVVNAESSRFAVESTIARLQRSPDPAVFREQFATLTLGSGAVAMVLSSARLAEGPRFLGGLSRAATQHAHLCTGQLDEMRTDAQGLLLAGLELAARTWKEALSLFDWVTDRFRLYAMHQVSSVHTKAIVETLGIDAARLPLIYPRYGNIGPAGVPTVLSKAAEGGVLQRGDRVALMGIGSGINATAAEVAW